MDQEFREAFATLSAQMAGVDANAREAASRSRETAAAVSRLSGDVELLKATVFGSRPPPGPNATPVVARITEGEGTVADLTGRVMALAAEVAEVKKQNAEQLVVLGTIAKSVGGVINSPLVKKIALVAGTVLLLWLSAAQAKLQGVLP